jgi:hypothetical protein
MAKKLFALALATGGAHAALMSFKDVADGSEFTKCVNLTDFNTKSLEHQVNVTDRDANGCCPTGFIPGVKHYNKYYSTQIVCGFKDDGSVSFSTSTSNGVKTCTYNKCFHVKMNHTCKDGTAMKLDGCCGKDNYVDDCKMYTKSANSVDYCLSYLKKYKMEGTSDKTDDVNGTLNVDKLYLYTPCTGITAAGSAPAPAPSGGSSPAPSGGSAPAPSGGSSPAPAGGSAPASGSGKVIIGGEEYTCETKAPKTAVDNLQTTFENYKSCDEKTQKYTLSVSGYDTELQAGKNGNSNQYGIGMMCKGGNMYYIYTEDSKQATFDAIKEGNYDKVLLQCLIKEGSSGSSGDAATASDAQHVMSYVTLASLAIFRSFF